MGISVLIVLESFTNPSDTNTQCWRRTWSKSGQVGERGLGQYNHTPGTGHAQTWSELFQFDYNCQQSVI